MLAKDLVRPIGMPLRVIENAPIKADKFDEFYLSDMSFAGKPIGFRRSTQSLLMAGEEWTAADWVAFRGRIDSILVHEGVVKRGPDSSRSRSSSFLEANINAIIKANRGRLRSAPWWLRWLFDSVVTKEILDG